VSTSAALPAMIGVVVVLLIVVLSIISLRRVRWRRKPHLGHWKEMAGLAPTRSVRGEVSRCSRSSW
jgi:hypothetical protein